MALPGTRKLPIYGALFYFAEEGQTVETVTVARTTKPAGSVFTDWEQMGRIMEASYAQERENRERCDVFDATNGVWYTEDTEESNAIVKLRVSLTLQEVSDFVHQMAVASTAPGGADGAYVASSQPGGTYKGWVKVQVQSGTTVDNVIDSWGELKLVNPMPIANRLQGVKPQLEFLMLEAPDNAGVMGTWA